MNQTNLHQKNHLRELIALTLVPQLGASRIRLLLQAAEEPQEIFRLDKKTLMSIDGIGPKVSKTIQTFNDWEQVDKIIAKTEELGATIITYLDDDYPEMLREIYDPPMLLWVRGSIEVLSEPGIAVVGTRRATSYGLEQAESFAFELAKKGLSVTSGLALGIDAAAHKSTLKAGGKTIGVLGSGIDVIYPQNHTELVAEIIDKDGAVISELAPGSAPDAQNFPERNRIVSGLTLGTLVVESGLKGGSMITAQSALSQNREVFVIPHSLDNANGIGCNHLIKRAAGKLVQSVDDIVEEFSHIVLPQKGSQGEPAKPKQYTWTNLDLDEEAKAICKALKDGPLHIDNLAEQLGESPHKLLTKLLELEMMNCIRQKAGKNFELK